MVKFISRLYLACFGAIAGLIMGMTQKKWTVRKKGMDLIEEYPEFYEKLSRIKSFYRTKK